MKDLTEESGFNVERSHKVNLELFRKKFIPKLHYFWLYNGNFIICIKKCVQGTHFRFQIIDVNYSVDYFISVKADNKR